MSRFKQLRYKFKQLNMSHYTLQTKRSFISFTVPGKNNSIYRTHFVQMVDVHTNEEAIKSERARSIKYDNIHAGAIVTERNRATNAEETLTKQVETLFFQVENIFIFFVLFLLVGIFACRNNARRSRF